ncbi:MAG TPA: ATP-binding protein [Ignavibacteria bacterium]|nr:ATP-binding protein [Ignavibacteria bacterium]
MDGKNKPADSKTKSGKKLSEKKVAVKKGTKNPDKKKTMKPPVSSAVSGILNLIPYGIALLDAKTGKYIYLNDECKKLLNLDKDEQTGAKNGFFNEGEITGGTGKKKIEIKKIPVTDGSNSKYTLVTMRDISGISKIQKNLKENESRIEKIFNITPDLVHIFDLKKNKTVFANKNFESVLGYKTNDIIKYGSTLISKLIHPDDRKIYIKKIRTQIPSLKDDEFVEDYVRLKNIYGEYLWFQVYECIYDRESNGNPASILSLMTNITNLKTAERNLKKINKQLQTAQDIAKLGYWEYDTETGNIEWSSEVYRLFDMEPFSTDLSVEKIKELFDKDNLKTINRFYKELKLKNDVSFILKINTPQSQSKHVQVLMHKSQDKNGNIKKISGTMQDITQRIIYEEKIKNYASLLEKENQSKNKYMSILAHDLKSPFAGMIGYSELLSEDFRYLSREDIYTYVKEMNSSLKGVYNLIETLLEWTRLHTGSVQYTPEKVNLLQIITEIELELKNIYKDKEINYSVDVSDSIEVCADSHMLRSIFTNLLSNSFKYTESGGSTIISAELKNGMCEISIIDTGVGIPPENLKKLYRIDENFSTPGTNNEKGAGLGLIICKDYLDLHNSELKVKSETGIGTTFSFNLKKS